ncbi:MAG TPA: ATP-binding protein, partial [Candidatus Limnocylindrales bacterium]|nr:ATP-binding protein [Candidatus Limnocylindrales bacterium]
MGGRVTSPVLVGRRAELEALRAALTEIAPGAGPIVTIAGDAGVGKSRLLAELVASIRSDPPGPRPVTVASAACIEVAAGELPYVPLLELLTNLGTDLAGPAATEASDLAGELAGADAGAIAGAVGTSLASAGAGRTRHLVRLHALLAGVADERDLVLILDDLQWADRSTLDAIAFLASRFAGGSVTIVLAYRSDDLHRRHPIRPWLGEIRRRS